MHKVTSQDKAWATRSMLYAYKDMQRVVEGSIPQSERWPASWGWRPQLLHVPHLPLPCSLSPPAPCMCLILLSSVSIASRRKMGHFMLLSTFEVGPMWALTTAY